MSDVFTKRRPMIDLDEFERRLSRPSSTDQKGGDVLAELLRVIGDKDAPHKTSNQKPSFQKRCSWQGKRPMGSSLMRKCARPAVISPRSRPDCCVQCNHRQQFCEKPRAQLSNTKDQPRERLSSVAISLRSKQDCWARRENKPRRWFQKPASRILFRTWTFDRNTRFIGTSRPLPARPTSPPTSTSDRGARSTS